MGLMGLSVTLTLTFILLDCKSIFFIEEMLGQNIYIYMLTITMVLGLSFFIIPFMLLKKGDRLIINYSKNSNLLPNNLKIKPLLNGEKLLDTLVIYDGVSGNEIYKISGLFHGEITGEYI